jgi:hypothetical protein
MTPSNSAQAALAALGGVPALRIMLGARNITVYGAGVSFKLPARFAKDGINYVWLGLDRGTDLFDLHFGKQSGNREANITKAYDGIFVQDIGPIFRDATGLELRIPKISCRQAETVTLDSGETVAQGLLDGVAPIAPTARALAAHMTAKAARRSAHAAPPAGGLFDDCARAQLNLF